MLRGKDNTEKIWNFMIDSGCNEYGAAGFEGNTLKESGNKPTNLQDSFEAKLGHSDESYTKAVDSGMYTAEQFAHDGAGYGIVQLTFWTLKRDYLAYAKKTNRSVGDLECQLEFVVNRLKTDNDFKSVWKALTTAKSVREASNAMLFGFERPSDQGIAEQNIRCKFGEEVYNKLAKKIQNGSKLVDYTCISPNKDIFRSKKISKITIHHMAGNLSVEECGSIFENPSRQASSNYGIGTDGRVGLYVSEEDRAWTSGNADNDNMAVTIEVANNSGAPNWTVSDKAYSKLIDLCTDICKRNGIKKLVWTGDASGNLTCHYMFQATACPGPYLKERMPFIAAEVNKRLGNKVDQVYPKTPFEVKCNAIIFDAPNGKNTGMKTGLGVFTIVEVNNNYGKLKSGAGWINLTDQNVTIR